MGDRTQLPKNVVRHKEITAYLNDIYRIKNNDYGNSFDASLDKHGLVAAVVRMEDKMGRINNLMKKEVSQMVDESINDTLLDLANYSIMSYMWLQDIMMKGESGSHDEENL